jgi:hypothetical protein
MKKEEYLAIKEVANFIKWFASDEAQSLSHNYHNRELRKDCEFNSLADALSNYYWPFNSFIDCRGTSHESKTGNFIESAIVLDLIKNDLDISIKSGNSENYRKSAKALMTWGGTTNFNNVWFDEKENQVTVNQSIAMLKMQDDCRRELKAIPNFRFNAGLTKLYSLLVDDFIIYDSRVAAALAWYVLKFTKNRKLHEIPRELRFACMPARGNQKRNPRPCPKTGFTGVNNNHTKHAHWNIRASWILSEAVKLMTNSIYHNQKDVEPIRALEAALFMWGYDLSSIT